MKTLEQTRIETKLKLWETPGFYQFIKDLSDRAPSGSYIGFSVESLRIKYIERLKELESKSKFKQGKLPL